MPRTGYWDRQFARFDKNEGRFVPTWSWWALVFNVFWYVRKGMWPKAFMFLFLVFGLADLVPEQTASRVSLLVFMVLYPPIFGKWDYYLVRKRGTYFW